MTLHSENVICSLPPMTEQTVIYTRAGWVLSFWGLTICYQMHLSFRQSCSRASGVGTQFLGRSLQTQTSISNTVPLKHLEPYSHRSWTCNLYRSSSEFSSCSWEMLANFQAWVEDGPGAPEHGLQFSICHLVYSCIRLHGMYTVIGICLDLVQYTVSPFFVCDLCSQLIFPLSWTFKYR